jgi:multiple antibiotic resistance protein
MIWPDLREFVTVVLLTVGALLPLVNPLGDAPLFLAMTAGYDESVRAFLARRIAVYSFALLLGSMLVGGLVLRVFGLSVPIVQLAGGVVVCALGWHLLADAPRPSAVAVDAARVQQVALGRAFYPLTMPLTVDAGGISVAITVGTHHSQGLASAVTQLAGSVIGSALIAVSIFLTYRYAQRLGKRIGPTGMTVLLQLSAFITLCIGVAISWAGLQSLLRQIGIGR